MGTRTGSMQVPSVGRIAAREIRAVNNEDAAIPSYGIVRGLGRTTVGSKSYMQVEYPTGETTDALFVNVNSPMTNSSPGIYGTVWPVLAGPLWVAYEGSAPNNGDEVGPTASSFKVSASGSGFVVIDVDVTNMLVWIMRLGGGGGCDLFHELSIEGNPTSGTFTWRYQIDSTNDDLEFDYDSTAAEAETVFEGHTDISAGQVEVTGGPLPHVALYVEFTDVSVTAVPSLVANSLSQAVSDPFDPQPKLRIRG